MQLDFVVNVIIVQVEFCDTSTRRLPSGFEIDDIVSSLDSQSQAITVYEVGQNVPHGPIIPIQNTTSIKQPEMRKTTAKVQVNSSSLIL